jgi:hypothetical protein
MKLSEILNYEQQLSLLPLFGPFYALEYRDKEPQELPKTALFALSQIILCEEEKQRIISEAVFQKLIELEKSVEIVG